MSPATGEERVWTIPNAICGLRVLGLAPLLWLAYEQHRQPFVWLMVLLLASDWVDGKLAILLDQRTTLGARLDSAADTLLYGAIGVGLWWLEGDVVRQYAGWAVVALASWGLMVAVSLVRFGRLPSYHTRGAKTSWLVIGTATVILLLTGDTRAVPWALGLVVLTNLEAVAIGLVLPEWRVDVPWLVSAWRIRRRARERASPETDSRS